MFEPLFKERVAQGEGWRVVVDNPAPGVLTSAVSGYIQMEAASGLMGAFDAVAAAQGPVDAFHDWSAVVGYDTQTRETYTAWSKAHRAQVKSVNILVGSRLVAMGISVANLMVGGFLKATQDRDAFKRALQGVLAKRGS